jgi:hypothetical protein
MNISTQQAADLIRSSGGQFFTATFTKRTDGTLRTMNCRLGVKSHLRGGEPAYDFAEKGLVPVYDLVKQDYRCFPLDSLTQLAISGQVYEVTPERVAAA